MTDMALLDKETTFPQKLANVITLGAYGKKRENRRIKQKGALGDLIRTKALVEKYGYDKGMWMAARLRKALALDAMRRQQRGLNFQEQEPEARVDYGVRDALRALFGGKSKVRRPRKKSPVVPLRRHSFGENQKSADMLLKASNKYRNRGMHRRADAYEKAAMLHATGRTNEAYEVLSALPATRVAKTPGSGFLGIAARHPIKTAMGVGVGVPTAAAIGETLFSESEKDQIVYYAAGRKSGVLKDSEAVKRFLGGCGIHAPVRYGDRLGAIVQLDDETRFIPYGSGTAIKRAAKQIWEGLAKTTAEEGARGAKKVGAAIGKAVRPYKARKVMSDAIADQVAKVSGTEVLGDAMKRGTSTQVISSLKKTDTKLLPDTAAFVDWLGGKDPKFRFNLAKSAVKDLSGAKQKKMSMGAINAITEYDAKKFLTKDSKNILNEMKELVGSGTIEGYKNKDILRMLGTYGREAEKWVGSRAFKTHPYLTTGAGVTGASAGLTLAGKLAGQENLGPKVAGAASKAAADVARDVAEEGGETLGSIIGGFMQGALGGEEYAPVSPGVGAAIGAGAGYLSGLPSTPSHPLEKPRKRRLLGAGVGGGLGYATMKLLKGVGEDATQ